MSALQRITHTETRLFLWLFSGSRRVLPAALVRSVSRCGDGPLYFFIGLLAWILGGKSGKTFFYTGLLAYAIELPVYAVLKNSIRRTRPCHGLQGLDALINPSDRFSFPSGHTAAACVFATLVAVFVPMLAVPAFIGAGMIGLSRVLLGVHYPSDILAGAALGVSMALLALFGF